MSQNIADFYTSVQANDFARQFQFRVLQLANITFDDSSLVYIETANLPGRSINNIQVPFMGLNFNVPGTASYPGSEGWSVTFRCDQNYNIRTALENATIATFDDSSSTGSYNIATPASNIILALLGKDGSFVRQYTLFGAYVVSLEALTYNLGDNGTIVTQPATLAYQYWRVTGGTNPITGFSGLQA
jgi:hypothetical protein